MFSFLRDWSLFNRLITCMLKGESTWGRAVGSSLMRRLCELEFSCIGMDLNGDVRCCY